MKKAIIFPLILAVTPLMARATGSSSITLPPGFTDNIWAQAQDLFTGINGYVSMIVGTILATIVIEILIGALKKPGQ